jgi:hypothetical protein
MSSLLRQRAKTTILVLISIGAGKPVGIGREPFSNPGCSPCVQAGAGSRPYSPSDTPDYHVERRGQRKADAGLAKSLGVSRGGNSEARLKCAIRDRRPDGSACSSLRPAADQHFVPREAWMLQIEEKTVSPSGDYNYRFDFVRRSENIAADGQISWSGELQNVQPQDLPGIVVKSPLIRS